MFPWKKMVGAAGFAPAYTRFSTLSALLLIATFVSFIAIRLYTLIPILQVFI
jgi:hypothetical protein